MSEDKKPFGETGFGQFLKKAATKLPELTGVAIDIVSGDVGGAIDNLKGVLTGSTNPEAQNLMRELTQHEAAFRVDMEKLRIEELRVHQEDRNSARERENTYTKIGKEDFKQYVVLFIGLGAFIFAIIATAFIEVPEPNVKTWVHLMGVIEGAAAIPIFTYFFGSSAGSKQKTDLISRK